MYVARMERRGIHIEFLWENQTDIDFGGRIIIRWSLEIWTGLVAHNKGQ